MPWDGTRILREQGKEMCFSLTQQELRVKVTGFFDQRTSSLVPSSFRSLNNVSGNVSDGFIVQASTECRHGVLSVSHLRDDCLLVTSSSKVGFEGLLLKGLFGHDHILSSSVTRSAVGVEDLLSIVNVCGKGRLGGDSESDRPGSGGLCNGLKEKIQLEDIQ